MPPEEGRGHTLETAHVLFIDMVSYSRLAIDHQARLLNTLQEEVRSTSDFQRASANNQLLALPTGDGMALVFFADPEAPARCAIELSGALRNHPEIKVRMGIHTGPVYRVSDINANLNVAGGGINIAQRVMSCGDADHILVSKQAADVLGQLSRWAGALHELGAVRVKHGFALGLFNLYAMDFGNAARPRKVRVRRLQVSIRAAVILMAVLGVSIYLVVWPPPPKDVLLCEWGKGIGDASISADGSTVAFDSDARGQQEIYVLHTKGGKAVLRTLGEGDKLDPRIKPDGTTIIYALQAERAEVWTVPTAAGAAQRLISDATCADWSPKGERIAYAREHAGETASLRIYDLSTGTESPPVYVSKFQQITPVRWSPNNEWIFFGDDAGPRLVRPDGGPVTELPNELGDAENWAWSADGKYLFYSTLESGRRAIWKLKVPDGKPERVLGGAGEYFTPLTPAGEHALIYAHGRAKQKLLMQTLKKQALEEPEELASSSWISGPAISPDGASVLYVEEDASSEGKVSQNVQMVPVHGGGKIPVAGGGQHSLPVWSHDGKHIAYSRVVQQDGQKEYWHIFTRAAEQKSEPQQQTRGEFDAYPDDWSPDGSTLLFTMKVKGKTALMGLDMSSQVRKTLLVAEHLEGGKYSADGRWVLALAPLDNAQGRGLWVLDTANNARNRVISEAVVSAKWALGGRAIIYSVRRKAGGKVNLWRLPMKDGQPSGGPSFFFNYPATSGAEVEWDVTDDLSTLVYVQTYQFADLYKRTPLR